MGPGVSAEAPSSRPRGRRRPGSSRQGPRRPLPRDDRAALLWAAERLVRERGSHAVTVEAVCARAKRSRSAFYEVFADRTDCLLGVFDEVAERAERMMHTAYVEQGDWLDGVRDALSELLLALDRNPLLARFMLLDSAAGDPPMLGRRSRLLAQVAAAIDAARPPDTGDSRQAPFGGEAVVGAIASILHGRLLEDPPPRLADLAGALMGVIVLPYLGAQAAREEVSRPPPVQRPCRPSARQTPAPTPAERLGFRMTQRTLRVLETIAERPGLNNRELAERAGIADAGQASRLLARLRGLQVIETNEEYRGQKAWYMTPGGYELLGKDPPPEDPVGS
jgi:AcrR family transcriptional regulator